MRDLFTKEELKKGNKPVHKPIGMLPPVSKEQAIEFVDKKRTNSKSPPRQNSNSPPRS